MNTRGDHDTNEADENSRPAERPEWISVVLREIGNASTATLSAPADGLGQFCEIQDRLEKRSEKERRRLIETGYADLRAKEAPGASAKGIDAEDMIAGWFLMHLWSRMYDHAAQQCLTCGHLFPPYGGECPECHSADIRRARFQNKLSPLVGPTAMLEWMSGVDMSESDPYAVVANTVGQVQTWSDDERATETTGR